MCTGRDEPQNQESQEAEQQEPQPQPTTEEIHEALKDFFGF